mmetsp:Transcript_59794/g.135088  ORF Transcript_59794/g.135088 Transcript_59794/m.135088 type:complete len:709 (+) Transcript_59794:110-2236(+)
MVSPPLFVLLLSTVVASPASAVSALSGGSRHASASKHRGSGRRDGGVPELVASLGEVVKGLETEQAKGKALEKERQAGCAEAAKNLSTAIARGEKTEIEAQEDLRSADAKAAYLRTVVDGLAGQLHEATDKIEGLTGRLKELRGNQSQVEEQTAMSLRQVEEVIAKSYLHERGLATARHPAKRKVRGTEGRTEAEVLDLQRLGSQLFASPSLLEVGAQRHSAGAGRSGQHGHHSRGVTGALRADKAALLKTRLAAMKGFDEEEKELLDLIKIQREGLKELEESLHGQEPVLANKLKESAQANRTLLMAQRGLVRDRGLLAASLEACKLMTSALELENKLRFQAVNLVKMPTVLIAKMDTTTFLARDLQHLQQPESEAASAPSFLQLGAKGVVQSAAAPAFLEESSTASALGPFDKVSEMIQALISSLQEQANDDVDRSQWCLDSKSENERERLATTTAIDTMMSEIHWAETAVANLEDEIVASKAEGTRLEQTAAAAPKELAAETARVSAQVGDHNTSKEIVTKVLEVLSEICDLDDSGTGMLLQRNRTSGRKSASSGAASSSVLLRGRTVATVSGKQGQCSEAAQLLRQAEAKIGELDQAASEYLSKCQQLASSTAQSATAAASERASELAAAEAAKAKRAMDLATAKEALKSKRRDLGLIEVAQKQLDSSCGPQVETREERMRRRSEEIEALRSALSVLEGEAVPI